VQRQRSRSDADREPPGGCPAGQGESDLLHRTSNETPTSFWPSDLVRQSPRLRRCPFKGEFPGRWLFSPAHLFVKGIQRNFSSFSPIRKRPADCWKPSALAIWPTSTTFPWAIHNYGSPVGDLGSGHVAMASRSFLQLQSDSVDIPWWSKLAEWDGPLYKDGYLTIPDKPGLGASLNEAVCKAHLAPGTKFF